MYSQYRHISWKEKLQQLFLALNISRAEFLARLPKLSSYYSGIVGKDQGLPESVILSICRGFDVNEAWMRGEVEEPILNSDKWVRSSDEEILSRVLQLKGTDTIEQFAAKVEVSVCYAKTLLENDTKNYRLTYKNADMIANGYHVGTEWLIYGQENSREFPFNDPMHEYLLEHPEARKMLWAMMNMDASSNSQNNSSSNNHNNNSTEYNPKEKPSSKTNPKRCFSATLQSIRGQENLTQRELAKVLGVSPGLISLIETDRRGISAGLMRKIKETFPTNPEVQDYEEEEDFPGGQEFTDSNWIKSIRKREKLSQEQFGEALGVTKAYVSLIETGKQKISRRIRMKIEETYGVTYPNTSTE